MKRSIKNCLKNIFMKSKLIENLLVLYFAIFLILMLIFAIQAVYNIMPLMIYSRYIYICGGIGLLLYIVSKIKNFKFNKYEIIIFIMILLSCLSLINAIDINTAIFGKVNRYEGLLIWLSYYVFILNAMNITNQKKISFLAILISIHMLANIFHGLYQLGVFSKTSLLYIRSLGYASGFLGNSNFLGSMSTIFYGLILGLLIKVDWGWKKYFFAIAILIASLGVLINGAMSAFVGVVVINLVCLVHIIVLIIKKMKNSTTYLYSWILGLISFILVLVVFSKSHDTIMKDISQLFSQTKDIVVGNTIGDEYGTGRIFIWENTIKKMKDEPITGYGIDNYQNAFNGELMYHDKVVDKAHNDYLQKAFCEGIISGIVFIAFLLIIFFNGLFSELSPIHYGLLLSFTCYSVQAFFNISFINVAPLYFIICGLLIGKLKEKPYLLFKKKY